ncbi:MAG: type II toxin-antitoxin system VapC family toxin [Deltaproteobacteria bacterium]|nr:type II toxin-antitoxin system VapC family toxin [Deltaproteobacteria bacterium]
MIARSWVLDASVAVKAFLPDEELADEASEFLDAFESGLIRTVFIPEHFFAECANVFWKSTVRYRLSPELAIQKLEGLSELSFSVVTSIDNRIEALRLAIETGISVYDALYVSLARSLRLPLISADAKLIRAVAPRFRDIVWLADWESASH